jgi:hypothetical protein
MQKLSGPEVIFATLKQALENKNGIYMLLMQ